MKFKQIREKYRSKFPASLVAAAVKIALDMGGNMTGAYKKIEKMKRGLGDDPMVKDALRLANENVNEETLSELNFSYAFFDKQSLNKFMMKALKLKGLEVVDSEKKQGGHYVVRVKSDDKKIIAKANSFAIRAMSEWVTENNPQETIIEKVKPGKGKGTADVDYIGDSDLTKKLEKKFKVKIKSSGRTSADIIGNKANIIKLLQSDAYMMDDEDIEELYPDLLEGVIYEVRHTFAIDKVANLGKAEKLAKKLGLDYDTETGRDYYYITVDSGKDVNSMVKFIKGTSGYSEQVNEAYSKKMSNPEIKKVANKYQMGDDEISDLKNEYSPKKTARPKAWLSLGYPVRDGDYYFAFISSSEKDNVKYNNILNDVIKKAAKEVPAGEKATDKADYIWDKASAAVKKFPRALGWNDTMARDEIWASIGHLIGVREEIEEVAIDKMRIGKRKKAPKWS